jgi:hypothetical protein
MVASSEKTRNARWTRLVSVAAFATVLRVQLRLLNLFEEIGVEDGGGDSVLARRPLAEVDQAAATGAEGNVFVAEVNGLFADGAEEGLR